MKTTITTSNELKNKLNQLKYKYGLKTIEEVIIMYLEAPRKRLK